MDYKNKVVLVTGAANGIGKNDFINGQNIIVDGGMTKKMIYIE